MRRSGRQRNICRAEIVFPAMNMQFREDSRNLMGPLMLILVGSIFLISEFVPEIGFHKLWPLLLIGGGVAALFGRR